MLTLFKLWVTQAIDAENEKIDLVSEAKLGANDVHKNIDEDAPRFTFFAYEHTHNGTAHDSLGTSLTLLESMKQQGTTVIVGTLL